MARKVFISHKNTKISNDAGRAITDVLRAEKHEVFLDDDSLEGGVIWDEKIINNLISSDVVIVVVDEETARSDWVQREIDMAQAQKISILPVILVKHEAVKPAFERFNIARNQYISFEAGYSDEAIQKIKKTITTIAGRIEKLSQETITRQEKAIEDWKERRYIARRPRREKPAFITYTHPDAENVRFQIATGDASLMPGYEILVNTENNYMQMARFYQRNTLSYGVRKRGAHMDGEDLLEDTIQYELNESTDRLPVPIDSVLATSAGHEKSDIRKHTQYRYILHAAAVRFNHKKDPPNQPVGDISKIIENCMVKVSKIDKANGEVKGKQKIIVPASKDYQPIQSILFPFFGAGEGGKAFEKVAKEMIDCFEIDITRLIERHRLKVNTVGLSIYCEEDVEIVKPIFLKHGFEIVT